MPPRPLSQIELETKSNVVQGHDVSNLTNTSKDDSVTRYQGKRATQGVAEKPSRGATKKPKL